MMKIMVSLVFIILSSVVIAQEPPDVNIASTQTMVAQHVATREFVSQELTRQKTEFFNQFEQRAQHYEQEVEGMIKTATWKLSLLWGSIVFIIFGVGNFLSRRLEKRKWRKMVDSAKEEVMTDIKKEKATMDQQLKEKARAIEQRVINLKKGEEELDDSKRSVIKQKEALNQAKPQLQEMYQKIQKQQKEMEEIMGKVDI